MFDICTKQNLTLQDKGRAYRKPFSHKTSNAPQYSIIPDPADPDFLFEGGHEMSFNSFFR